MDVFLRKFLSEELQADTVRFEANASAFLGFPTNKAAFNRMAEKVMQEPTGIWISNYPLTYEYELDPPAQTDVDKIIELINSLPADTPREASVEDPLMDIITESASNYFNGLISAEDAARVIQSRASIYVSERS